MDRSQPPFLRGPVERTALLPSVWVRGLEDVRETADRWAGDLSAEPFWWVPGPKLNSIGGLLRHIAGAGLRLMHYAVGEPVPAELLERAQRELQAEPGLEPAQVLAEFHGELARVQDRILGLTEADLGVMRELGRKRIPIEAAFILHHLVEHAQHHAGQIIVLRKLWDANRDGGRHGDMT